MPRHTLLRLRPLRLTCVALGTNGHASFVDPYRVLGLPKDTPFEEIRKRFHELTQQYHPDMPTGNPDKFRDINAAYRQIRADYRHQKENFDETAFGRSQRERSAHTATGGDFWAERNAKVREEHERRAASERRARKHEANQQHMANAKRRGVLGRMVDVFHDSEIWLSLCLTLVVFVYAFERYLTMLRMSHEKQVHLYNIDHGLPPPMPMEVEERWKQKYDAPLGEETRAIDSQRAIEESVYRKATQRRFSDFREFMYVYDPEGVAMRKVTTERFSFQYLDEAEIQKRCPVIKNFNSELRRNGYESMEKDLSLAIKETPWASPDMGYAAGLVAKGLGCVPANSPNTTKWTFIEYQDMDKSKRNNKGRSEPVCLVAVRNHRFDKVGMCQRMVVTGREDLVPELAARQEQQRQSGAPRKKDLVTGRTLPIKDLSMPLKDMDL